MEELYYPSADGKNTVHACIWQPKGAVSGVVQIIHGMCEHAVRYTSFALFLNSYGYVVCAEDHLGHGKTAKDKDNLGYFDDKHNYKTVLADIHALRERVRMENQGVPYFVLGHSMGSFFCRNYIAKYGEGLAGAVIMGTGFQGKGLMNFARFVVRCNALFCGWKNRSQFIKNLAFGDYNERFVEENDEHSWLSVDLDNRKNYRADEYCGFDFTDNGYYVLFSVIRAACSKKTFKATDKELPIYLVAGSDDPVGNYGEGVRKTFDRYVKSGQKEVLISMYEGARHEILSEVCRDKVSFDLLEFFNSHK